MAYFDYSLRSGGILEKTKSETRRGIEPHEPVCAMFMAYKCRVRSAGGQPSLNGHSPLINPHDFHASTTGTVHIKGDTPCYALPGTWYTPSRCCSATINSRVQLKRATSTRLPPLIP